MPHVDDPPPGHATPDAAGRELLARRMAITRLVGLVVALSSIAAVFLAGGLVGPSRIQGWIEPLGPYGPVLYVPVSAVLGTLFVPGAALAAAAGLLFGPWVGALAALAGGTLAAILSRSVSGRAGQPAFDALATGRVRAVADLAREHGILAVVVAPLAPGVPPPPLNHAFGVAGLSALALGLGHLISAGPRALAYATIGANTDHPTGTAAIAGWALNLTTGALGIALLAWVVIRHRRTERLSGKLAAEATQE